MIQSHCSSTFFKLAHAKNDTGAKLFSCTTCGAAFTNKSSLDKHKKNRHFYKKHHLCDICGNTYASANALEIHWKTQHGQKNMPCSFEKCGKMFSTEKHLNKHLKHHGERKFVCPHKECGASFVFNSRLTEHLQNHADTPNYACHICSKTFWIRRQLKKHVEGVHAQRDFNCDLCSFTNTRRDNLRSHYYRAHPEITKEEVFMMMPPSKPGGKSGRPLKKLEGELQL